MRRRRAVEVEALLLVAHWADLHSTDPRLDPRPVPGLPRPPGGDRLVRVGGEAIPRVRELSLCELGIARGVHPLSARAVTADVLGLRHRLPRRPPGPLTPLPTGEAVWQTPPGRHRLVDPHGTHHLTPDDYTALTGDDPLERALARLALKLRTAVLPQG